MVFQCLWYITIYYAIILIYGQYDANYNLTFVPSDVGRYKIVITDSWILKCGMHSMQAIRQSEAELKYL